MYFICKFKHQLRSEAENSKYFTYILMLIIPCILTELHFSIITSPNAPLIYRVSQEEWTKLRESVPYVNIYRYNPKHQCPKLNGYGDKGQRKV